MDKLKKLMSMCKCGVSVSINDHKSVYQTVAEYLKGVNSREASEQIEHEEKMK